MISRQSLIAVFVLIFASLVLAIEPVSTPTSRPLGAAFRAYSAEDSLSPSVNDPSAEPSGNLTLAQAQAYGLMHSPRLQSLAWERKVAEARRQQAGVYPNPELGFEIENGPGTGELRGFDNAEQTLQVSQLIELGGKRHQRLAMSRHEQDLTNWDFEAARLDVLTEVSQRFYGVLAAQERAVLAEQNDLLAENVLETAAKRVQTGIASLDEEMKARLAVSLAQIEKDRAERTLTAAKIQLATTWGSKQPRFARAQNGLDTLAAIPAYEQLAIRVTENPEVARWNSELARRQGNLDLEEAGRTPDITLAAGIRRFSATADIAMVMGASVPLPLFNTNRGNIRAAHFSLIKGRSEHSQAVSQATAALSEAYGSLSSAFKEATQLKDEIMPGSSARV